MGLRYDYDPTTTYRVFLILIYIYTLLLSALLYLVVSSNSYYNYDYYDHYFIVLLCIILDKFNLEGVEKISRKFQSRYDPQSVQSTASGMWCNDQIPLPRPDLVADLVANQVAVMEFGLNRTELNN